jgi:leucyl aminopeptidase
MPATVLKIDLKGLDDTGSGDAVVLSGEGLALSAGVEAVLGKEACALVQRAAIVADFKSKARSALSVLAPEGVTFGRMIVMGLGPDIDRAKLDWTQLGGATMGNLTGRTAGTVLLDAPGGMTADQAADFVLGLRLRAYHFDRYKTKTADETAQAPKAITVRVADPAAVKKALKSRDAVASGVDIARDLVNEPPNVLTPTEFAKRASELAKLGVEIEILGDKELKKIGMRALLGVGQGSAEESKVVIMRWNGGKASAQPVAFIGKGVVFDTGGISIKPAQGMEDMKGDMAGAACVVGLMHALAARKAKCNVIGAIGLVENMPDGKAQRPGDIVKSLSGQTIEIINTDAEGRLVLGDVLWYVQDRFKPQFMINLATLTGAILVALGAERAGLFSNNDELATRLHAVGETTTERVWRMPLGPEYDKMVDSKFADMKNSAGRYGGSITAAQFLQRFVNGVPWAHLDIAGTGMASANTDTNRSWGSGWGVRLLDRLVSEHYE